MIQPAGHRVLILPDAVEEITKGGIVLPKQVQDNEQLAMIFGTVVAVGPNAWKSFDDGRPWAAVGDRVAIAKYGGFVIEDPETKVKYRLINDEDVVCLLSQFDKP